MNPVVGIDVSKGESQGQVFLDRNKPIGKNFRFTHTSEGLRIFLKTLRDVEKESGVRPAIILEATGHYHLPLVKFAEENSYLLIVLNPLTSQRAKKSHLRKVKTDTVDAYHLGELYYKEEFDPYKQRGIQLFNLRQLTRQHESMTTMYVQAKLQFQAVLDQLFPQYVGIFGDLYAEISLRLLQAYPTPQAVQEAGLEQLIELIQSGTTRCRSRMWAEEKAKKIMTAAQNSPFKEAVYESHVISIQMLITLLLQYREHLSTLEQQIDALAEKRKEYDLLRSIPGVGNKIAATILSEIGEIGRFDHPKKLVAFAGVDPSIYASGKFTATSNRITKRGSKRLRRALFLAVQCGLQRSRNQRLRAFYDLKREEGKPYKVALIACVNKLLRWIYAILKREEPYRSDCLQA
jgi:transposase